MGKDSSVIKHVNISVLFYSGYKEYTTDVTVRFILRVLDDKLDQVYKEGPHNTFKLHTTIATSSMVLFDAGGVIKKYDTALEILEEFYALRIEYYGKRKKYLVGSMQAEATKLSNQVSASFRFIH